jgi:hypothetical protein
MSIKSSYRAVLILAACCALASGASSPDWRPVDSALLSMKAPVIDKDADVEGVFWDISVEDADTGGDLETVLHHYIRLKVFTERGKEYVSKVEIPYSGKDKITDIEGRTIKADGSSVMLQKEAIFERTLASAGKFKIKAKTFALPAVEPGVIVEYRWKEVRPFKTYTRFYLQRDIPIQEVAYHIKPYQAPGVPYGYRAVTFNHQRVPLSREPNGFYALRLEHVPAFKQEPQMPPEDTIRAFVLGFYRENDKSESDQFWQEFGRKQYEKIKPRIKPNDDVKKATVAAIEGARQPEEIIEKIFHFVRSKVKNIDDDASGLTPDQRAKIKDNKSPADTLKHGTGTGEDIALLFASMVTAAGLDARIALTGDRGDFFFDPKFPDTYFLSSADVAVRVGDAWRFYDPSSAYLTPGMLSWREEFNSALIPDAKEPLFVSIPLSPPDKSLEKRTAKLQLSEDGTLEGDVRIEYTGHLGAEKKEYDDADSQTEREETLKKAVKDRLSTAELSNIQIENVTDHDKPFTYRFHIRVPAYAQRTGKRLFLQPAFFQKGIKPLFATSDRKYEVYFHFPWSENDEVEVNLPQGYDLESPEGIVPIDLGPVGKHQIKLMVSNDHTLLICKREFSFGGGNHILFQVAQYPALKRAFDDIHEADNHTITLRQKESPK